jgi:hypothetical protein
LAGAKILVNKGTRRILKNETRKIRNKKNASDTRLVAEVLPPSTNVGLVGVVATPPGDRRSLDCIRPKFK